MITVADLSVRFGRAEPVVSSVSFGIASGECFALVGQSGSGKSVTARALLGLTGGTVTASALRFDDLDLLTAPKKRMRRLRGGEIGFVSQGALVALDPLRTVGREVGDTLRLHTSLSAPARASRVVSLLETVGIPDPEVRMGQRADELSGGLRQRALIASAIALQPRLLIADEPTTALDSTVAAGILDLLDGLRADGTAILLISHDLATVARLATHVAVMQNGRIVESGSTADVLTAPQHPYTRSLLAAIPAGVPRHARLAPPVAAPFGNSGVVTPTTAEMPLSERKAAVTPEFPKAAPVVEALGLRKAFGDRVAVDDVSFALKPGRTLGIVGESGSGKTTVARLVLALERPDAGEVRLFGEPWTGRDRSAGRIGAIYQDALSSFDPRWTVERILGRDCQNLLELVGLPRDLGRRRPRFLSGGQQQRVGIARAIAAKPQILVCDEPVSSLDVSAQATILDLLDDLQERLGLSYLFISHDLGVIRHVSDDVLVMRNGRVLESGPTERVFAEPEHDYTRALIAAAPTLPR